MKKTLLLLVAGAMVAAANAQERQPIFSTVETVPGDREVNVALLKHNYIDRYVSHSSGAYKTTSATERWYNYRNYMKLASDMDRSTGSGALAADYVFAYAVPIWNDTFGIIGGSPARYNNMVSIGTIIQPQHATFNRADLFGSSSMKLGGAEPYTVDSIYFAGYYNYGTNAATGLVDTLRVTIVTGDGSVGNAIHPGGSTSGAHYGTVKFWDMYYDSVQNKAVGGSGGGTASYFDILLRNSDTGFYDTTLVLATVLGSPLSVAGGNVVGISYTFKSGQPGIFSSLPGDTLIGAVTPFTRYNMFRPLVNYYTQTDPATVTTTAPAADWAPYDSTDHNVGYFKKLPNYEKGWINQFIPTWAWSGGGGSSASIYQYPEFGIHVNCPTCSTIPLSQPVMNGLSGVRLSPNPADDKVSLTLILSGSTSQVFRVSLLNMVGQVVTSETVETARNTTVQFNTASLPSGAYVYCVESNGEKSTGRVLVAH